MFRFRSWWRGHGEEVRWRAVSERAPPQDGDNQMRPASKPREGGYLGRADGSQRRGWALVGGSMSRRGQRRARARVEGAMPGSGRRRWRRRRKSTPRAPGGEPSANLHTYAWQTSWRASAQAPGAARAPRRGVLSGERARGEGGAKRRMLSLCRDKGGGGARRSTQRAEKGAAGRGRGSVFVWSVTGLGTRCEQKWRKGKRCASTSKTRLARRRAERPQAAKKQSRVTQCESERGRERCCFEEVPALTKGRGIESRG